MSKITFCAFHSLDKPFCNLMFKLVTDSFSIKYYHIYGIFNARKLQEIDVPFRFLRKMNSSLQITAIN